jgi:hypothetical protein
MSTPSDARRVVGALVHAKAHFCTNATEAKRLFGVLWNTKLVNCTVLEVLTSTSGRRANVSLKVEWQLPARLSVKTINLRSAKHGEAPSRPFLTHQDSASNLAPAPRAEVEEDDVGLQTECAAYSQSDLVASDGDVAHAVGDGSIVVHGSYGRPRRCLKILQDLFTAGHGAFSP